LIGIINKPLLLHLVGVYIIRTPKSANSEVCGISTETTGCVSPTLAQNRSVYSFPWLA